jgi:hypothetical protein
MSCYTPTGWHWKSLVNEIRSTRLQHPSRVR